MEALRRSLKGGGAGTKEKAERFMEAHAKKKGAAKSKARRKRAA